MEGCCFFMKRTQKASRLRRSIKRNRSFIFYNPNLTWMIWDDSLELMQYDEIYFASLADVSTVEDDTVRQADQVLVYVSRMEQTEEALQAVADGMGGDVKMEKIGELLYCDLYLIARK